MEIRLYKKHQKPVRQVQSRARQVCRWLVHSIVIVVCCSIDELSRELEKILTDEIMDTIRPKRINVLTKGEKFDRINLKEKRIRRNYLLIGNLSKIIKTRNKPNRKTILATLVRLEDVYYIRL